MIDFLFEALQRSGIDLVLGRNEIDNRLERLSFRPESHGLMKRFKARLRVGRDIEGELESDGWAFMGLIEVTNLHNRELVRGLLEGRTLQETFSDMSRDTTRSAAYLDKLKEIYAAPIDQDSIEAHPLREKEIVDAWVEEWRRTNRPKPSESSIIADITALLPGLSEDGLRRIQAETNKALSVRKRDSAKDQHRGQTGL